jgi:hypothetical protein
VYIQQGSIVNTTFNNSYRASISSYNSQLHKPQATNTTSSFNSLNTKQVTVSPKLPEKTTQPTEKINRTCYSLLAIKKNIQNNIVSSFVNSLLLAITETNINPNDTKEGIFIPQITNDDFFIKISPIIKNLVIAVKDNILDLNEVIDDIKLQVTSCSLNSSIKNMCYSLLNIVKSYEHQKKQLSLFWGINDVEHNIYVENIYKLFIEGDRLYSSYDDFNNDTNDLGEYVFESENLYLCRCFTGLSYTVKELIIENKSLNIRLIDNIIGIFASEPNDGSLVSSYTSNFHKQHTDAVTKLLAQGKVAKYITFDNANDIPEALQHAETIKDEKKGKAKVYCNEILIEDYINSKLSEDTKLYLKESEDDPDYYIVDKILKNKNGNITTISADDIKEKQPCIFEIKHDPQQLSIKISFDDDEDHEEYMEKLINDFNKEISATQTDLEYVTALIKLASSLQRAHIYRDANGRYTFFNLVIALLIKKGLFPTKQPFNLWKLVDVLSPKELAEKYLALCIKAPNIQINNNDHWLEALPESEQIRVACATGDQAVIEKFLTQDASLLLKPVPTTSAQSVKKPLSLMRKYNHYDLYTYTVVHPQFKKCLV